MKKSIMLLLFGTFAGYSQEVSLSGKVQDGSHQAVPFADAMLLKPTDSLSYKTSQTNEKGAFVIENIEKGNYILKVSAIGFGEFYKNISLQDSQSESIVLNQISEMLDSVTITSKRPVVKRLIDRLEFSVENSSLASNNAWEILSKTPGVNASATGNISVRGSQSILVTINDKKVYLTGEELKNFLESTSGQDVKSVEVITNPPAKYEAQGSAVLNIKLKKNFSMGYKGSVYAAYVQSMYAKGVTSTSHFYKGKKLSVSGRYTFGSGVYLNESNDVAVYEEEDGTIKSRWESIMRRKFKSPEQHSYRFIATYDLDTINSITVGTSGFFGPKQKADFTVPTYIYGGDGALDSLYVTSNNRRNPSRNTAYHASFDHIFGEKEKLTIASDFTSYGSDENQDIRSAFSLPNQNPYRFDRFLSLNNQEISLFSVQMDYINEKDGSFETGLKFGNVNADNSLDFSDEIEGVLVPNLERTSLFLYDESIFAGYVSYGTDIGKWSLKAGLRGEYTSLEGNSVTTAEENSQNYFKLFPTLYALYKPSEGHQIGLSYGKRISRPQYSRLNPFRSYYNSYSYFTGDPKLLPTIIHNINLQYTLKEKYNFDLFYRLEKDPSMEISYQDYETNMLVYNFTNIEKDWAFGLEFNTNLTFFDWWEAGIQAGLSYVEDSFQGIDGKLYENGRPTYNGSINNRFALNKKKDFNGEVNFNYNSSSVQGTFVFTPTSNLSVNFRKKVMKGKAEIFALFSDIYRGQKQTTTTDYGNQYNSFRAYGDSQSFRIGFRYDFGNQKLENKKKEVQTEEQQRL